MTYAVDKAVENFDFDTKKSYTKNGKEMTLLTPPETCPPGKDPESVEYDGNHPGRKAAEFRRDNKTRPKKKN